MVRQKKRWLLVQIDFDHPSKDQKQSKKQKKQELRQWDNDDDENNERKKAAILTGGSITRKDLHILLRDTFISCFGVAGVAAASYDTQVRWMDSEITCLALVRCSRDWCGHVRAALTLLNPPKQQQPRAAAFTNNTTTASTKKLLVTRASVVSVHGSARTAKLATMARVRSHFRQQLERQQRTLRNTKNPSSTTATTRRSHQKSREEAAVLVSKEDCPKLESMLKEIDMIDSENYFLTEDPVTKKVNDEDVSSSGEVNAI